MGRKNVLVLAYYSMNFGDDLFLKVLIDRYPNVNFDLLTANRNYNNIFDKYDNVKIIYTYRDVKIGSMKFNLFFKIHDFLLKFNKYDAFINIGGSIFMQSAAWNFKFLERQYLLSKFKENNKKTFIIGANFGPYEDKNFYEKYDTLLGGFDDVCFRDKNSYSLFKELNNVRLAPDVVFNLKAKSYITIKNSVGLSIIDLRNRKVLQKHHKKYINKIIEIILYYMKNNYTVKLFSFCENEGDLKAIKEVLEKIDKNNLLKVINYNGNIDVFIKEFKECETIIGTRFHSVILSLLFNQNLYPLIYSMKTLNVLRDLNVDNSYTLIEEIENVTPSSVNNSSKINKLQDFETVFKAEKQFEKLDLLFSPSNLNVLEVT